MYMPKKRDKHPALQLDPRKERPYSRGGVGGHPGLPRPDWLNSICVYYLSVVFFQKLLYNCFLAVGGQAAPSYLVLVDCFHCVHAART
jgi:hypothetical protein